MSLAPAHAELRHSVETVETIDPASLPPRVSVLTLPGPSGTQHQVYLLGTAHISEVGRVPFTAQTLILFSRIHPASA